MNDTILDKSREISLPLRLKILFEGAITQVWYLVFAFLMLFLTQVDLSYFTLASSINTKGTITNTTKAMKINRQKTYLYAFDYTFLANNQIYNNTSFSLSKPPSNEVTIEYSAKDPRNSRIMDMQQKKVPIYGALIGVFAFNILLYLLAKLKNNLQAISLLKNGEIGYAKLLRTETTNTEVEKQTVMKVFYEFEDKNGKKHEFSYKAHAPKKITDEAQEMLFYDANNPKRNMLKDSLVTEIVLVENKKFQSPRFAQVLPLLILPFIGIAISFISIFFILP